MHESCIKPYHYEIYYEILHESISFSKAARTLVFGQTGMAAVYPA